VMGRTRLGSSFAVLDFSSFGSSVALRNFRRLGSTLSLFGRCRVGASVSLLDICHIGSSVSVRNIIRLGSSLSVFGFSRVGASVSVLDFLLLGSSLSLRSFPRLGATLSVFGVVRLGASMSVLSLAHLGASLSLCSSCSLAADLSVAGTGVSDIPFQLYNPLSLREATPCGSSLSLFGIARFGATMAVLDSVILGSSLSMRSRTSLASSMSVLGFVSLGASLSLRCFFRLGSAVSLIGNCKLGNSFSMYDNVWLAPGKVLTFPGGWTISWDTSNNEFSFKTSSSSGSPPVVISTSGGRLHGTWATESIISASDRRLKREVEPLVKRFLNVDGATVSALLSRLRPKCLHASGEQQGFSEEPPKTIGRDCFVLDADDLEGIFPDVVRGTEKDKKIVYQDLLALLAMAAKERQQQLELHEALESQEQNELKLQEAKIEALEAEAQSLSRRFVRIRRLSAESS